MKKIFLILFIAATSFACKDSQATKVDDTPAETPEVVNTDWENDDNIYEVNIRQYTPEGTFSAFKEHLPRLKAMGVDILWLMPIYPISDKRKKGSLGSYYAISDYTKINPEFGTMDEFKALVGQIHDMGMRVILDWVPNHTGWNHSWIEEHPDFYTQDSTGTIIDPIDPKTGESWGWTDVADLNYDNKAMRQEMRKDMAFWLTEVEVDGFRCDVAGEVPDDFWVNTIDTLRQLNPDIFMLAEAEHAEHRNICGFDMNYGWSFHHLMNEIAKGDKNATDIDKWFEEEASNYKKGYFMHFLTNHDENSWNGTIEERMGEAADAFAVLAFTFDGMPLIYSGQEAGLNKRLEFFEKDSIAWGNYSKQDFYTTLLALKHDNSALWNGEAGGKLQRINTADNLDVYAFYREKDNNRVVVIVNLSDASQSITLDNAELSGSYSNVFANSTTEIADKMDIQLGAWEYLVLQQ